MMPDISSSRVKMAVQEPCVRNGNFDEVEKGYTYDEALMEAGRCLNCRNKPCVTACPVSIDIPLFIKKITEGDIKGAYDVISSSSSLPAVCGRVCPQETQCEGKCVRGIKGEPVAIGRLERFVADYCRDNFESTIEEPKRNGHKVAVVGAGPAGLTAAGDLAKLGYEVTVYEALHIAGGVLMYGIPEFRLPKKIVKSEIERLKKIGVKIETNVVIGKTFSVDDLFEMGNEVVYVASGAGLPRFMGISGEGLNGVYSANEYLTRINLMKAYENEAKTPVKRGKNVAVVGGGNVAMDAARSAKRLGADNVYIIYRRGMEELPARREEVVHAMEEGVIFKLLSNVTGILGDEKGSVTKLKCVEMELGEPDSSGRRSPVPKENSEFDLEADTVIMAIGTTPNPLISDTTPGLETDKRGCIITTDEWGLTTKEAVFAGGDAVTGSATVILAMGAGKRAAVAIDEYIMSK